MLTLSRKKDEGIVIGDAIFVTIADIRGDKVQFAIKAPLEIPIHRQEVYEENMQENVSQRNEMLVVISRKRNESIVIGRNTIITVIDIRGDKMRIGIEVPKETPIHRQEVYEAVQKENGLQGG